MWVACCAVCVSEFTGLHTASVCVRHGVHQPPQGCSAGGKWCTGPRTWASGPSLSSCGSSCRQHEWAGCLGGHYVLAKCRAVLHGVLCESCTTTWCFGAHHQWIGAKSPCTTNGWRQGVSCKPINGSALLIATVDYASRTRVISATLLRYTTSCPEPPGPYAHSSPRMYSPDTLRSTASISSVLTATLDGSCTHPWSSLCSTHPHTHDSRYRQHPATPAHTATPTSRRVPKYD